MSRWWMGIALALLGAALGALCASCDTEAKSTPGPGASQPARVAKPPPPNKAGGGEVVFADPFERVRIEAEAAAEIKSDDARNMPGKLMRIVEDKGASGGKCIAIPDKAGTPEKEGRFAAAIYRFTIKKPGLYTFWCRRKWCDPPQCGDTFAVRFDKAGQRRDLKKEAIFGADDMSRPPRWGWSPVHVNGRPRQFFLAAGEHAVEILNREDGPKFDVILLTNDPDYVPQGLEE